MGSEQFEFRQPTDEEYEEILRRRARSDKVSKLMADYLLKGYRMLASYCPICTTVLLADRTGTTYCVACQEVDHPQQVAEAAAGPSSALLAATAPSTVVSSVTNSQQQQLAAVVAVPNNNNNSAGDVIKKNVKLLTTAKGLKQQQQQQPESSVLSREDFYLLAENEGDQSSKIAVEVQAAEDDRHPEIFGSLPEKGLLLSNETTSNKKLLISSSATTAAAATVLETLQNSVEKLREKNRRKIVDRTCAEYADVIKSCAEALHALKKL